MTRKLNVVNNSVETKRIQSLNRTDMLNKVPIKITKFMTT